MPPSADKHGLTCRPGAYHPLAFWGSAPGGMFRAHLSATGIGIRLSPVPQLEGRTLECRPSRRPATVADQKAVFLLKWQPAPHNVKKRGARDRRQAELPC